MMVYATDDVTGQTNLIIVAKIRIEVEEVKILWIAENNEQETGNATAVRETAITVAARTVVTRKTEGIAVQEKETAGKTEAAAAMKIMARDTVVIARRRNISTNTSITIESTTDVVARMTNVTGTIEEEVRMIKTPMTMEDEK